MSENKEKDIMQPYYDRKSKSLDVAEAYEYGECAKVIKDGKADTLTQARIYNTENEKGLGMLGRRAAKMEKCADNLEFVTVGRNHKRLMKAYFCKDRLCPMCNWRRALKFSHQMSAIMGEIRKREISGRFMSLMFIINDIDRDRIEMTFNHVSAGFGRMMMKREIQKFCIGAVRHISLKYEDDGTYAMTLRALLWVKPEYFDTSMDADTWSGMFKDAAALGYNPPTIIREFEEEVAESPKAWYIDVILDAAKQVEKPVSIPGLDDEYLESDDEKLQAGRRVSEVARAVNNKKLIRLYGIFNELHGELDMDDIEDGNLIAVDRCGEEIRPLIIKTKRQ